MFYSTIWAISACKTNSIVFVFFYLICCPKHTDTTPFLFVSMSCMISHAVNYFLNKLGLSVSLTKNGDDETVFVMTSF